MEQLAPVATLVVATVERLVWANELTLGQDVAAQELGLDVLELLVPSELAGREELEILEAGLTAALVGRDDLLDDGWEGKDDGGQRASGQGVDQVAEPEQAPEWATRED